MKTKSICMTCAAVLSAALICMPTYAAQKTAVSISGLSAPENRAYNGNLIRASEFGSPSFSPNYNGNLIYAFYEGNSASGNSVSTPSEAGNYTVRVSVPDNDPDYTGHTDIPFTITKEDTVLSDISFSPASPHQYTLNTYTTMTAALKTKSGEILIGQHISFTFASSELTKKYWLTTDTNGIASEPTDITMPAGDYTVTVDYAPSNVSFIKNYNAATTTTEYIVTGSGNTGSSGSGSSGSDSSGSGSSGSGSYTSSSVWIPVGTKWQFKKSDGTVAEDAWLQADGKWYHFDAEGFAQTGWIQVSGKWYHCNPDNCAMDTGLYYDPVDQHYYYLNPDGSIAIGWVQINDKWYYFNAETAEATYAFDAASQTWIWNSESENIPLGAMLKNTITPDGHQVDENGVRTD